MLKEEKRNIQEKERILNENKRIKEIPIRLKGKKGERESYDYLERGKGGLPEGAVEMQVKQKTITDLNGEPIVEITKIITFEDGSVQKLIDKQPL